MSLISPYNQREWASIWKEFRNHDTKEAFGMSVIPASHNPGEVFWHQITNVREFAPAMEKARQYTLYTDFIKDENRWWSPSELTPELVDQVMESVTPVLYHLQRKREIGFFSIESLRIYKEEFENFSPDIEFNKEYEITDFGNRLFGLEGPHRRYLERLIADGILKEIPEDLTVMGQPIRDWLSKTVEI